MPAGRPAASIEESVGGEAFLDRVPHGRQEMERLAEKPSINGSHRGEGGGGLERKRSPTIAGQRAKL